MSFFTNFEYNFFKIKPEDNITNNIKNRIKELFKKTDDAEEEKKIFVDTNKKFENIDDFINDYLNMISKNIFRSLERLFFKYEHSFYYDYLDENIHEESDKIFFNNIDIQKLLNCYEEIFIQLDKKIEPNIVNINTILLANKDSLIEKSTIFDILTLAKEKRFVSSIQILDLYLKDIKQTPFSYNNTYNFIYFLRMFPIFKEIINHYFKNKSKKIADFIEKNDCIIKKQSFFKQLFGFKNNKFTFANIINLNKDILNYKNLIFKFDFLENNEDFNIIELLKEQFEEKRKDIKIIFFVTIRSVPLKDKDINDFNNDLDNFYNKIIHLTSSKEVILELIKISLNIDFLKENVIKNLDNETLHIYISNFLFKHYFIGKYLNLERYETYDDFKKKLLDNLEIKEVKDGPIYREKIFEYISNIYFAYIIIQTKDLYQILNFNIKLLKEFFHVFHYFKSSDYFPLFLFLSTSSDKIKVIKKYDYKKNLVLSWLDEKYDIIFTDTEKIIL